MKFRVLITFFVLMGAAFPVPAQEAGSSAKKYENESEFYPVSVPVEKIYNYPKGYIVRYRRGPLETVNAYLPLEWFTDTSGRGEILRLGTRNAQPRLVVYYKGGEFSHVRLYVHPNPHHITWGLVRPSENLDREFENQEGLKLKF
jgi:hypothetical protein